MTRGKVILLYTNSLSSYLLFSELLAKHSDLFSAVIELPGIPKTGESEKISASITKKLRDSSFYYLLFNAITVGFFSILSNVSGVSIAKVAKENGIACTKYQSISKELLEDIDALRPNWVINGGANILGSNVLDIPAHGTLNLHCAPLPQFRGAANYFWLHIEKQASAHAVLHYVDVALDAGDIIQTGACVEITPETTVFQLWKQLRLSAYPMFESIVTHLRDGTKPVSRPQDEFLAKSRSFPKPSDVRPWIESGGRVFSIKDLIYVVSVSCFGKVRR